MNPELKPFTPLQRNQDRPSLNIFQPISNKPLSQDSLSPTEPLSNPNSTLSRASSAKSTSSVQAVPFRIPARSPPSNLHSQFILNPHAHQTLSQTLSSNLPEIQNLSIQNPSIQPQLAPLENQPSPPPAAIQPLPSNKVPKRIQDLIVGDIIGEGSYSTVYHVTDKSAPEKQYALKVLDKRHIQKEKKIKYVAIERDSLNLLDHHPGCIRLYSTFQDEYSLYYLLEFAPNGEILKLIKLLGSLSSDCARFYSAQILTAIEHMHSRGVIHRDVKPENILLDSNMRIKIADYGSAKILAKPSPSDPPAMGPSSNPPVDSSDQRSHSFVGTADYVSPELLVDKVTSKRSDLWAFGCVLFQMIAGVPPFRSRSEYLTFQNITNLEYTFPEGFPTIVQDLISKLLVLNPNDRLGIEAIKAHEFYESIDWAKIWQIEPPIIRGGFVNPPPRPGRAESLSSPPQQSATYSLEEFPQERVPPSIIEPDQPRDSIIREDEDSLETEDGPMRGLSWAVTKRSSWLLNSARKRLKDDDPSTGAPGEMTWVEVLLPNELMIYSATVNEITSHHEETGKRILSFGRALSKEKKKKRRQLVLTDLPRLLCVKENEKRGNKVRIKYQVLFQPAPPTVTVASTGRESTEGRPEQAAGELGASLSSSLPPPPPPVQPNSLKHEEFLLFKSVEIENHQTFRVETVRKSTAPLPPPSKPSRTVEAKPKSPVIVLRFEDISDDLDPVPSPASPNGPARRWFDELLLAHRVALNLPNT